jgi:hypothetical protein
MRQAISEMREFIYTATFARLTRAAWATGADTPEGRAN